MNQFKSIRKRLSRFQLFAKLNCLLKCKFRWLFISSNKFLINVNLCKILIVSFYDY